MIDFSKIKFSARETFVTRPGYTTIRGEISLVAEIRVMDSEREAKKSFINEELRRMLNHKTYGELREPLAELVAIAQQSQDFQTVQRVEKLNFEILRLLSLK